jgi:hypothetical protein
VSAAERARSCFRLAAHPATGEGERSAAMARGMALIGKYGLDPDDFDIPGRVRERPRFRDHTEALREQSEFARAEAMQGAFGSIFGQCAGCGAVASVGAMCLDCLRQAEARACRHGRHGHCFDCEPDAPWMNGDSQPAEGARA